MERAPLFPSRVNSTVGAKERGAAVSFTAVREAVGAGGGASRTRPLRADFGIFKWCVEGASVCYFHLMEYSHTDVHAHLNFFVGIHA